MNHATVPILTYHSITRTPAPGFDAFTVHPSLFEEHLAALREHALDVITFGEVPDALAAGTRAVAISIDDGLADVEENACPLLARVGVTATLFVPSAFVGSRARWLSGPAGRRRLLSWRAIDALARQGFEIGSHGHKHLAADINFPDLVERDARRSRLELEDHLGRAVRSFAYPFGYHSSAAQAAVRNAGYWQACGVGDLPARAGDDRWALPRLQVWNDTTPEALVKLIMWRPTPHMRVWAHSKQRVWRLGRRFAGWGPPEAARLQGATR
jgi:peptidoglycan/xylan/chitin deacetylase (PgdA/CDA1 family)